MIGFKGGTQSRIRGISVTYRSDVVSDPVRLLATLIPGFVALGSWMETGITDTDARFHSFISLNSTPTSFSEVDKTGKNNKK